MAHLAGVAVGVGLGAGVGAIALTLLLHGVQHLAYGYTGQTFLHGVQQVRPWRRFAAMACGGVLVAVGWACLRRHVDTEEVSVTRALREKAPRLPVVPTLVDSCLQIIGVGAGASLGREGAPRQAGAALAGWLASRMRLPQEQRHTLMACGAGAGLAAVYNVPLAGMLFTLELLLVSRRRRDVALAALTSLTATLTAWPVLTDRPTYAVPPVHFAPQVLVLAVLLGPVLGVAGVLFVRLMTWARTHAPRGRFSVPGVVLGFAVMGALSIPFPQLLGNGKGPAELAFVGTLPLGLAAALALLKPLATATGLASGAIGGLLTPALATGALVGLTAGRCWTTIWPGAAVQDYAIVAAAALLAVTQRAPLMAVVIVLEFVHTGIGLLPAILLATALAVATATGLDGRLAPTWWGTRPPIT